MAIRNRAARRWGHRYVMGAINAYCPACSGGGFTALTCDFDDLDDSEEE